MRWSVYGWSEVYNKNLWSLYKGTSRFDKKKKMRRIKIEKTNPVENSGIVFYFVGVGSILFSIFSTEPLVPYFFGIFLGILGLIIFRAGGTKYFRGVLGKWK